MAATADRERWVGLLLGVALLLPAAAGAGEPSDPARIDGHITLAVEGLSIKDAGPLVVYLEAQHAGPERLPGGPPPEIRQRDATFTPGFMAVQKGQTIRMPNDDDVRHNVYSTSEANAFDLGIYDAGKVRSVKLKHPGQVDIHCSVHESMNGTIFVSPSPWYASVDGNGRFLLDGVPPGRYRLRTWSARLPTAQLLLRVHAGATLPLDVTIGAPASPE